MIARLEIDLGALRRNAARLRAIAAPARAWFVVKANAYGHGLAPTAAALEGVADGLCVYHPEEGIALRAAGVRVPILVLGPTAPEHLEAAHAADLALTLWDTGAYRRAVTAVARKRGAPFAIHAKIDTGVTRFGFDVPVTARAVAELLDDPDLRVAGAFTHLAAVEEMATGFTFEQLDALDRALDPVADALRARGALRHAAASAATLLVPRARLDLVRIGIAGYGLWPSPQTRAALPQPLDLEPALSWRSTLVAIREVETGRAVGYGCTYHTAKPTRVGVVPIGYAEGVPRAASNRGAVLIAGKRAPIVGRVCMNVTLVDITEIPAAVPGARVTLIGKCEEDELRADDWATWTDTINYEIVTRLPSDVPRAYGDYSEACNS